MKEQQDKTRQEIAALQDFTVSMVSTPRQATTGEYQNRAKINTSYPGNNRYGQINSNLSGQQSGSVLCYCCGVAGHFARDCKHRSKVCNICKKVATLQGHVGSLGSRDTIVTARGICLSLRATRQSLLGIGQLREVIYLVLRIQMRLYR